jgi:hypothetical protein
MVRDVSAGPARGTADGADARRVIDYRSLDADACRGD